MKIKTLLLTIFVLAAVAGGFSQFIGVSETYEGLTERIPLLETEEDQNSFLASYNGSTEYSNIVVTPEYLKLVNKTTGDVNRTFEGVNRTFTLSELDETPVFEFSAKGEYVVLVSFKINDSENRSLIYNEIDSMRYKRTVDFRSKDSVDISIGIKDAEGDILVYSPDLEYQKASRSVN